LAESYETINHHQLAEMNVDLGLGFKSGGFPALWCNWIGVNFYKFCSTGLRIVFG